MAPPSGLWLLVRVVCLMVTWWLPVWGLIKIPPPLWLALFPSMVQFSNRKSAVDSTLLQSRNAPPSDASLDWKMLLVIVDSITAPLPSDPASKFKAPAMSDLFCSKWQLSNSIMALLPGAPHRTYIAPANISLVFSINTTFLNSRLALLPPEAMFIPPA